MIMQHANVKQGYTANAINNTNVNFITGIHISSTALVCSNMYFEEQDHSIIMCRISRKFKCHEHTSLATFNGWH